MTCSKGCCESNQEHWRSIAYSKSYGTTRQVTAELDLYKKARDEGSQPAGTKTADSRRALDESDRLGRPFRADDLGATYYPEHAAALRPLKDASGV